ncbi:DUF2273 domain-containing protein [Desulfolucanica intricata]|uniref:DUF2273 domain-containing protein n=1 Tax=Desulfolucanica intricata TaxID=1285191 RepID=UPI00082C9A3D|nr:DUF2273 domain-containing protein [Desulfolucanica intricata]
MDYSRLFQELWNNHKGKIIGVFLGLLFGWFSITYGLFKAIFVALCVGFGYYAGKKLDEQVDLPDFLSRIFRAR